MPIFPRQRKTRWYRERSAGGCEMCGWRLPGRPNSGLHACHIVRRKNQQDNVLMLCPSCHVALDKILKPALHHAIRRYNDGRVPGDWAALSAQRTTRGKEVT